MCHELSLGNIEDECNERLRRNAISRYRGLFSWSIVRCLVSNGSFSGEIYLLVTSKETVDS